MSNKTLCSCIYFMYARVKYKLITAHNLLSYAHRFGFPEVNKSMCTTERNSYSRYKDNAFIFQIAFDNHIIYKLGLVCR